MSKENNNNQLADAIKELTLTLKQMNADINEIKNDVKVVKNNTSTILEKIANLENTMKEKSSTSEMFREYKDIIITTEFIRLLRGR